MAAEREVIYHIRYEVDPKTPQTMQDVARQAEEAQKQITRTEQREVAERGRIQSTGSRFTQEEMTRAHSQWVRRRIDNERRLMSEHLTHQAQVATAHAALIQQIQTTAAQEMQRGALLAVRGIEQIGRGLVILKAIDEETAQSALKLIGGFEAMIQLGKGVYNTYLGVSRALEAYSVSARAAAIAQTALNAAQAGGGAAGAVAAAGRTAGGGAAALGAGIGIVGALAGTTGGALAIPAAAIGAGLLFHNWLEGRAIRNAQAEGVASLEQYSQRRGDERLAAEYEVSGQSAIGDLAIQRSAALAGVGGQSAATVNAQAIAAAQARGRAASGKFAAAQDSLDPGGSFTRQIAAAREEVQAQQELVRLTQQRYTIEMDRISADRRASDQAIKNAKTLADSFRAIRDAEKERVQTAEQRFGSLDALQRQNVLRAARKASSGQELTEADSQLLDQFGDLGNLGTSIRNSRSARAKRGGFDELAKLTGADQRAAAAQFFATDAEVAGRGVIRAETEIRVKLDADAKALGTQIATELRAQFKELEAAMLKQLDAEKRQRQQDRNVNVAKARAAAGG